MSLVVSAWVGLLSAGVPTLYCPFPALTIIPAFWFSQLRFAVVLVPAILFFLWNPALLNGQSRTPKRTIVLALLLSALTLVEFTFDWNYGVKYQGLHHTVSMLIINLVWLALLSLSTIRSSQQHSFVRNLLSHWILFAWLSWYAFPYLGELP
jgi:hypothetical protein